MPNCGFHLASTFVPTATFKAAVVKAAQDEQKRWFVGSSYQKETDAGRFGDLVAYSLAGQTGNIHPKLLELVKTAALGYTTYTKLTNTALNTATTAVRAASKDVDVKAEAVRQASDALDAAKEAYATASAKLDDLTKDTAAVRQVAAADKIKVRDDLLTLAGSSDHKHDSQIESALQFAHESRADAEAWSAVFVGAVVRAAAIAQQLEITTTSGAHRGKNVLLAVSQKHWQYVTDALSNPKGAYRALTPRAEKVEVGDIIITDRRPFAEKPLALTAAAIKHKPLHGDIVIEVGTGFAVTIGGNVQDTVRKRRYPLDAGKLVVDRTVLYVTETDTGTLPAAFPNVPARTMLHAASTQRIISLLKPVELCKSPSGSASKKELEFLPESESPFAEEEILMAGELETDVDWIVRESPFAEPLLEEPFVDDEEALEEEVFEQEGFEQEDEDVTFAEEADDPDLEAPWEVIAESLPPRVVPAEHAEVQFEHDTPALPAGLRAFEHWHQPMKRDAASNTWVPDGPQAKLEPLDPGFFDAAGELKTAGLHEKLKDVLVDDARFSRYLTAVARRDRKATAGDQIRVALVDLTGSRLLDPDYAGWGSTVPVYGASCPKVAALYAAFQLRNDLKHVAAEEKITKTANLIRFMNERWKRERVDQPPRLQATATKPGLLYLKTDPPALEFSAEVDDAIDNLIDPDRSAASANVLIDVIGFPYIASLLWQSGLRHPSLGGIWLLANYGGTAWSKPVKPAPLPIQVHNATALSMAAFFTLLGQDRLAQSGLPRTIKSALSTASYLDDVLPSGVSVASKVGLLKKCVARNPANNKCTAWIPTHTHEAAFIENGRFRYAVAMMITGVPTGVSVLQELIPELDTLIRNNNP